MADSRRAASGAPSPAFASGLKTAVVALSAALGVVTAATAVVSARMARRVVTPAVRLADTRLIDLDTSAQTVTLSRSQDTALPGRYGLFTDGSETYLKLGTVLAQDETTVTRKLLTHIGRGARLTPEAAFSGWYYSQPDELHVPFTPELIGSPLGPCPAWLFPAGADADVWVIQVHGRGATRAECLRAVPVFLGLGITCLLVSYRNDGDAPRSRAGTYALGATEWRDVDAAIAFARRRGARRVVLMGWSMGGAVVLQAALNSAHRDAIAGVVLDSPVVDWRIVLDYQAKLLGLPHAVAGLAVAALQREWATPFTGAGGAIPFDRLDVVARAAELRHPILVLHSDDDLFVPSGASHALLEARPDLVELHVFETAGHTKLWNYDEQRWSTAIADWLRARGLTADATHAPADDAPPDDVTHGEGAGS